MIKHSQSAKVALILMVAAMVWIGPRPAMAADVAGVDHDARAALQNLYDTIPGAKALGAQAKGILVFPSVVKGGFIFGAQYGEGALFQGGITVGHYNLAAVSYGLQAGVQSFGYALFFMTDSALRYLNRSEGFEVGVGPSIVVVDAGMAKTMTTMTMTQDVYAFVFEQKGLMAGVGLQGSKITKINQ